MKGGSHAWKRKSLDLRYEHKMNKKPEVEKSSLLDSEDVAEEDSMPVVDSDIQMTARRHRRLHLFFFENIECHDVVSCKRMKEQQQSAKQPPHVNTFRLARFFGQTPPTRNEQGDYNIRRDAHLSSQNSRTWHLQRFFGENMDPEKEANTVSFATQPLNVSGFKLKKIFGESASHSISFAGATWPKSRAKLEKILGPYEA